MSTVQILWTHSFIWLMDGCADGVIDILSLSTDCTLHGWSPALSTCAYIHFVSIDGLRLSINVLQFGLKRKLWRHQSGTKCLHHSPTIQWCRNGQLAKTTRERERGTICHCFDQSWNPIQGAAFPECWLRRLCHHNWGHLFMSQTESGAWEDSEKGFHNSHYLTSNSTFWLSPSEESAFKNVGLYGVRMYMFQAKNVWQLPDNHH